MIELDGPRCALVLLLVCERLDRIEARLAFIELVGMHAPAEWRALYRQRQRLLLARGLLSAALTWHQQRAAYHGD